MANKYISTTGSDAANGSISTPWLTFAYGFSHISSLDVLQAFSGVYDGDLEGTNLPSGVNDGSRTIVKAVTGEVPIIKGYTTGIGFTNPSATRAYITFDGLTFDGSQMLTFLLSAGFYVGYNSSYITLQNSIVKNYPNCPGGVNFVNSSNGNSDNCRVIGCTVFNNGNMTAGGGTDQQHGIYAAGTNQLFESNIIYGNAGYGMHLFSGVSGTNNNSVFRKNRVFNNQLNPNWGSAEVLAQNGDSMLTYNNLIYRLGQSKVGDLAAIGDGSGSQFLNNTLYTDNASDGGFTIKAGCVSAKARNNIVFGASFGITDNGSGSTVSNNTTTNPSFVSAAGSNFYLLPASICIDDGFDTSAVLSDDIVGTPRPQHVIYDIGAYEYIFPPTPPSVGGIIVGIVGGL